MEFIFFDPPITLHFMVKNIPNTWVLQSFIFSYPPPPSPLS